MAGTAGDRGRSERLCVERLVLGSAADCAWTEESGAAWLTIADGVSGSGSNSIALQPVNDTVTVTQRPEAVASVGPDVR